MDFYDVQFRTGKGEGYLVEVEAESAEEAETIANSMVDADSRATMMNM